MAGDTVGLRGELYVRGDRDRAAALFEFKSTAEEGVTFAELEGGACKVRVHRSALPELSTSLPEGHHWLS